jgi:branched-chain amino acid transport system ATP-binding protein
MGSTPLLKIEDVTKSFGGLQALNHCSLKVGEREIVGLIGPNGAGKTTLLNVISGVLKCDRGQMVFRGEKITGLSPHEIARRGIGRTFQIPKAYQRMTVWENLIVASRTKDSSERALELLEFSGLLKFRDEFAGVLSYGQQKFLYIIRALTVDPLLLMLDEPTAGLSSIEKDKMMNFVHHLNDKFAMSFLIIEHDMGVIEQHCHRVNVLHYGENIAEGTFEEIRREKKVREAYLGGRTEDHGG